MVELHGLAVPFDTVGQVGARRVLFRPGAFARSIREGGTISLRLNHGDIHLADDALGRSLSLWEDKTGVQFRATVNDPVWARRVAFDAANGFVTGVSVSWLIHSEYGDWRGTVRVIHECELREISLMIAPKRPAFANTFVRLAVNQRAA